MGSSFVEVIGSTVRADGRRVVVAYHALSDTFPIGTLRGMLADAGWHDEDLQRLGLLD
jgi:predicted RNA binding protein YcfA (HicA-like mRNA interferase family)